MCYWEPNAASFYLLFRVGQDGYEWGKKWRHHHWFGSINKTCTWVIYYLLHLYFTPSVSNTQTVPSSHCKQPQIDYGRRAWQRTEEWRIVQKMLFLQCCHTLKGKQIRLNLCSQIKSITFMKSVTWNLPDFKTRHHDCECYITGRGENTDSKVNFLFFREKKIVL